MISNGTGNFGTTGTWSLCSSAAALDADSGASAIATGGATGISSNFTPGAITVDGIALKFSHYNTIPTSGTFTITLRNTTAGSDVISVTCNYNDLPTAFTAAAPKGWWFFKFANTLLLAATTYAIKITNNTNQVINFYRDATGSNWSRQLRTTTTQAPSTGDTIIITGDMTGAGTSNAFTVTMDNTGATVYGIVYVGNLGTLTYGTTASTAYQLLISGVTPTGGIKYGILVGYGGTLNVGTSGTPMPSTSSGLISMSNTSMADFGVSVLGGTISMYGAAKNSYSLLTSTAASGQKVVHVVSTTGWLAGDTLMLTSTSGQNSDETGTIATVDSSTQVTMNSNLTNAHTFDADSACAICNLSQNVQLFGASTTNTTYLDTDTSGVATIRYAQFKNCGGTSLDKYAVTFATNALASTFKDSSIYNNANSSPTPIWLNTNAVGHTVDKCVLYNFSSGSPNGIVLQPTASVHTITNNVIAKFGGGNAGYVLQDVGSTVTGNYALGVNRGYSINENLATLGTFSNNTAAYCGDGLHCDNGFVGTISSCIFNRNGADGVVKNQGNSTLPVTFDTCKMNGNGTSGVNFSFGTVILRNCTIKSETSFIQVTGVMLNSQNLLLYADNCIIGGTSPATHSGQDIGLTSGGIAGTRAFFTHVVLGSTTEIDVSLGRYAGSGIIGAFNHDQVTGEQRVWKAQGQMRNDTVIFATSSPSYRMTPGVSGQKLDSRGLYGGWFIPVAAGQVATVTAKVRKSVTGDAGGATYNGNQPRLMLQTNTAMGVTSDTVLATSTSAGNGSFESLSGATVAASIAGVFEVFVDCDGTAGWINFDDITIAVA